MPVVPKPGEDKETFVSRCIATEINNGHPEDQAAAMCYSKWEQKMSDDRFKFIEKFKNHMKSN